jgi:V/A-type H+-transporting ATPase subunit C
MARLDHLNARLGARRDGALGSAGLEALLVAPSLEARWRRLRLSRWWAALPAEPGPEPLPALERALRELQREEATWLLARVEGRRPKALLSAWLALGEADALKVVLRGVSAAAPLDRILLAAPATPGLPEALLHAAAAAGSPEGAVRVLEEAGHRLAAPLLAALPERRAPGVAPLEAALDGAVHEAVRAACAGHGEDAGLLLQFLGDRIDARNAATLLSQAGGGGVVPFLPGGRRLGQVDLDRLARLDEAHLAEALAAALPGLGPALVSPWGAELGLERLQLAAARKAARAWPLSVAVPVAHLLARRLEARRIAVALRGVELGLAADELLSLVEDA